MTMKTLTRQNFAQEVENCTQPVVVDFWAEWCGPCMMLSPIVDELAQELPGVKVMKCNVDEERELAIRFGIENIPALLKFAGGRAVGQSIGYKPKAEIAAFMQG